MGLNLTESDIDKIFTNEISVREVIKISPMLMVVTDKNGTFRLVSKGWTDFTGYTLREMTSGLFVNFIHPDDIAATMKLYQDVEIDKTKEYSTSFSGFVNRYKIKNGGWLELEWFSTGTSVKDFTLSIAIPRKIHPE